MGTRCVRHFTYRICRTWKVIALISLCVMIGGFDTPNQAQVEAIQPPEYGLAIQTASDAGTWHRVYFTSPFSTPPVVLIDDQAGEVRAEHIELRNVGTESFEYRFAIAASAPPPRISDSHCLARCGAWGIPDR